MTIFACLLALSCSKAMPDEAAVVPAGEKVTFTIPGTKVTIGADEGDGIRKYAFEDGDVVYAVTTDGSVAAMEFKGENTFAGEFSKPVGADEKISLYYNCYSAEKNATAYVQNGKPWLVSPDNGYSRNEDNTIVLSATLDAPKDVVGLPVISTFECTIDFHAKNKDISIASFDGKSFSGGSAITGITLKAATGKEYAAIVNVPAKMEGGFWIKAVKGQQSMYKSTAATVSNKSFIMKEFTPASVSIDVQISGFATSYSYYAANEEIEGISAKDVNKANSVSNDWMGPGKAVCTITKSGIPSTLLSVKSVSLFVNGTEFPGIKYTEGSDNTITIKETTGHTTWEQKNLTVKVVYTTPDGAEFESNTSNTLTRYITGLPYKNKNYLDDGIDAWKTSSNTSWNNGLKIGGGAGGAATAEKEFDIPDAIRIQLSISDVTIGSPLKWVSTILNITTGSVSTHQALQAKSDTNGLSWVSTEASFTKDAKIIKFEVLNLNAAGGTTTPSLNRYAQVKTLNIEYR